MTTPHKHAELIKAWADGAQIEFRVDRTCDWASVRAPVWEENFEYRIEPEPKPDVVLYGRVCIYGAASFDQTETAADRICIVFDGETGGLKEVRQICKPSPAKMEALLRRYAAEWSSLPIKAEIDEALK